MAEVEIVLKTYPKDVDVQCEISGDGWLVAVGRDGSVIFYPVTPKTKTLGEPVWLKGADE